MPSTNFQQPNVEQERGGPNSPGQLDVALLIPYLATFPAGSSGNPVAQSALLAEAK